MEPRRVAPVIGLCVLVAADAALIGWAFRGTTLEAPPAATAARTVVSTPTAEPVDVFSGVPATKVVPLKRFVTAFGAEEAWVVDVGSCAKPGSMWSTFDAGASWDREATPGAILRAKVTSGTTGFVTGGDAKCTLRLWRTGDAGVGWVGPSSAENAWSRVPDDDQGVHTAKGQVVRPCGDSVVVDLSAHDTGARVLCGDGSVRVTATGAEGEWTDEGYDRTGGLALSVGERGQGLLVRSATSCKGVVVTTITKKKPAGREQCVTGVKPVAGKVAVGGGPGAWWLVVGDTVLTAKRNEPDGWAQTPKGLGKS